MVSSVNTNINAMAAIASLNAIGNQMQSTQGAIESGLKVGSASDNPAVFTIAQGLRSNVSALGAVSSSLATGVATLQGQSAGATSISNTLVTLLNTVTQAQNQTGAALAASNSTITAALANIDAFANATTINGVNLLASAGTVNVLSNVSGTNTSVSTTAASTSAGLGLAGLSVATGSVVSSAVTLTLAAGTVGNSASAAAANNVASGDTFILSNVGGVSTETYTFGAAGANGNTTGVTVAMGADFAATMTNLAAAITSNTLNQVATKVVSSTWSASTGVLAFTTGAAAGTTVAFTTGINTSGNSYANIANIAQSSAALAVSTVLAQSSQIGDTAVYTGLNGAATTYTYAAAASGTNVIATGSTFAQSATNLAAAINATAGTNIASSAGGVVSLSNGALLTGTPLAATVTTETASKPPANNDTITFTGSNPGSTAQTFTFSTTPTSTSGMVAAIGANTAQSMANMAATMAAQGIQATANNGVLTISGGTVSTALAAANDSGLTSTATTNGAATIALVNAAINKIGATLSSLGSATTTLKGLSDFTDQLSTSVTTSLGAMVDANLSEESAQLSSLQTKQSLAIQSLSLANQGPGALLQLFR